MKRGETSKRRTWAEHRARLEAGLVPLVPAAVVAQAGRSPKQAQLRRLLRGCEVIPFDESPAYAAGTLLGKARTRDVVDASIAAPATNEIQERAVDTRRRRDTKDRRRRVLLSWWLMVTGHGAGRPSLRR